jgi:hypothetical protein
MFNRAKGAGILSGAKRERVSYLLFRYQEDACSYVSKTSKLLNICFLNTSSFCGGRADLYTLTRKSDVSSISSSRSRANNTRAYYPSRSLSLSLYLSLSHTLSLSLSLSLFPFFPSLSRLRSFAFSQSLPLARSLSRSLHPTAESQQHNQGNLRHQPSHQVFGHLHAASRGSSSS